MLIFSRIKGVRVPEGRNSNDALNSQDSKLDQPFSKLVRLTDDNPGLVKEMILHNRKNHV